jgi:hypothetical protein
VASDSDAPDNLLAFKPKLQSRRETGTKRKSFLWLPGDPVAGHFNAGA